MWRLQIRRLLIAVCVMLFLGTFFPEKAKAGEYTDAYDFYQAHGSEMVFKPTLGTPNGTIYYGTIAKQATSNRILYKTLGWKVTVRNSAGRVLDQIYYRIGGSYMKQLDESEVNGYEYELYSLSLLDIRNRLTPQAQEALKSADCSVTFDACTTVVLNGQPQGEMTDDGILSGQVYTNYTGISTAQNWSAATKETLKSYFNKVVPDLFCTVSLTSGPGISSVTGAGKYLYGTEITIDATPMKGYAFNCWYGTKNSVLKELTFMVDHNVYMTAMGKTLEISVCLHRNLTSEDTTKQFVNYLYTDVSFPITDTGWKKTGYHQLGWNTIRNAAEALFGVTGDLPLEWLESIAPSGDLYAIWEPNQYTIVFDGQGAEGSIDPITVKYNDRITMPKEGFFREEESLLGWSLSPDSNAMDFEAGETVAVADIVNQVNLADVNHATITLYVVWDAAPQITGSDIYVTLRQIQEGSISENWLAQYMKATDVEDGNISYGRRVDNSFYILDYNPEEFLSFTKSGYLTQNLYAVDSAGNETYKTIKVHIVDENASNPMHPVGVRFISEKYYKNAFGEWIDEMSGGLISNSIWRLEESYRRILDALFME